MGDATRSMDTALQESSAVTIDVLRLQAMQANRSFDGSL